MIRDIVHLNINVTDVDRSITFYERLGFQTLHVFGNEPTEDTSGGMDFGDGHMRGAVITLGEHPRCWTKIELIQWVRPATEPQPDRTTIHAGVSRIALRCKNLLAFYDEHLDAREGDFEMSVWIRGGIAETGILYECQGNDINGLTGETGCILVSDHGVQRVITTWIRRGEGASWPCFQLGENRIFK